ncbi:MAG: glutathione S-transferase [bacterium]|nr:glutathione S-transferase [bacterium]MCP5069657.1 glutathione S-transferase [bacterium]
MPTYRLFSWEHSYFSGKVRAYLRFKQRHGALEPGFEDILATPELIQGLLLERSGSVAVPQLEAADGSWIQDSSEIIDFVEAAHPGASVIPDPITRPRQNLVAYLIELLADEWMVVPGFWERWYFSEDGRSPSHRGFNEQQWGAVLAAGAPGKVRRQAGASFFEAAFGISKSRSEPRGVFAGLVHLGCGEDMETAWQASQHRLLERLEAHFSVHDYVLGGMPSLADFGLLAPLYAHLYRDAVAGFALRTHFPLVCEWVERTNGEGALNARMETQKLYSLDEAGKLVGRPATSDGGAWLADDAIAQTLIPVLEVFFEEMWPVLRDASEVLTRFIASDAHDPGGELPGKTFTATPGFEALQTDGGALTHRFEIRGAAGRRMVIPYQVWMLQRIEATLAKATSTAEGRGALAKLLGSFPRGGEILDLSTLLAGCRIRKEGALLYSVA